jgi:hypothetical protein
MMEPRGSIPLCLQGRLELCDRDIGDADGRDLLAFRNTSALGNLSLGRSIGTVTSSMIASPIKLLQQLAHATHRAGLGSLSMPSL